MQTEINYLGQLSHPNLVKLIGYSLEDDHRILVYEFVAKGSLDNHLFRSKLLFELLFLLVRTLSSSKSHVYRCLWIRGLLH